MAANGWSSGADSRQRKWLACGGNERSVHAKFDRMVESENKIQEFSTALSKANRICSAPFSTYAF